MIQNNSFAAVQKRIKKNFEGKINKNNDNMLCKYKSLRNAYFLPGISNKMMVPQPPARGSTNFAQLQITKYLINGTYTDIAINGISKIAQ